MNLQYSGEEKIAASPAAVWAFVQDPEKVAHCLPEVVEVNVQDQTHVDAVVQVAVGPVRGKFKIKLEVMPDLSAHRIDVKISGGGFGSAMDLTAGADVVDAGDGTTLLQWSGQAVARGPVATVGGRVLDSQAKKMIEQAFANIRRQLSG
ncbi:MAG TPA: carbon monoxide dehydrogenase subunit G [Candidatus Dormibacteraeota bacterium]|nr:carbon monoxide dehydrogenase subunit G [Candidatus Dormibacteraeota bacterium]